MINLKRVVLILDEVDELVAQLDGIDLNERDAVTSQSVGEARKERAHRSQQLNLLADRLELAATLVRNEYWVARGQADPIDKER